MSYSKGHVGKKKQACVTPKWSLRSIHITYDINNDMNINIQIDINMNIDIHIIININIDSCIGYLMPY